MHELFYNWILAQEADWCSKGIRIEKIINRIDNPIIPGYPLVCVQHVSPHALGQISLHRVCDGYIADFEAIRILDEKPFMYSQEFSESSNFDLWQKSYVEFLHSGNVT